MPNSGRPFVSVCATFHKQWDYRGAVVSPSSVTLSWFLKSF